MRPHTLPPILCGSQYRGLGCAWDYAMGLGHPNQHDLITPAERHVDGLSVLHTDRSCVRVRR